MDERRRAERAQVALFAQVTIGEKTFTCPTHDLSTTGIQLEIDDALAVGTALLVSFELPDSDRTIELTCEVARQEGDRVGVRFVKVPKKIAKALDRFVDESY